MEQVNAPKRQVRRLDEDEKNGFLPLQAEDDVSAPTRLMFFDLADYKKQLKDME